MEEILEATDYLRWLRQQYYEEDPVQKSRRLELFKHYGKFKPMEVDSET